LNQNSLLALDWKGIPRFRTQTACVAPVVAVTAIAGTAICRDRDDGMRLTDDIIAKPQRFGKIRIRRVACVSEPATSLLVRLKKVRDEAAHAILCFDYNQSFL